MTLRRWYRFKPTPPVLFTLAAFLVLLITVSRSPNQLLVRVRLGIFGNEISCYRNHDLESLPDISDDPAVPKNSIFFHETSCSSSTSGKIVVTGRQACAVESAALLHPERNVYLLFTSPGSIKPGEDDSDLALKALLKYQNVKLGHVDFLRYLNNTPLEHLYTSGSIELSIYAGSHASDVLRYLTLWKYGGVYLDLDVVLTKTLDTLGENYAGSESAQNVAAGVLGFAAEGPGHKWAQACLDDLSASFTGRDWGHNGPGVITRLLRQLCKTRKAEDMLTKQCDGFKVMPPNAFYPIPWWNWTMYFNETLAEHTMKLVKNSYAIHVWNKHSHNAIVTKKSAYGRVAKDFCPNVYTELQNKNF